MSDEQNLPAIIPVMPINDLTIKDLEDIEKFKEDGMIGLAQFTDVDIERCMGLYLDGKSYRQIAQVTRKNRTTIMFLGHKFKWFELRDNYLEELRATMPTKVIESKLQSQEFLLHLTLAYQKKIGKNIDQYLRTDDEKMVDKIDSKDLSTLLKVIEMTHKLNSENLGSSDKPLVGLNGMGEGVTITKTGENSVEITPKSPVANRIKQMADFKREQERLSKPIVQPAHDISKQEQTKTEEGKDNE